MLFATTYMFLSLLEPVEYHRALSPAANSVSVLALEWICLSFLLVDFFFDVYVHFFHKHYSAFESRDANFLRSPHADVVFGLESVILMFQTFNLIAMSGWRTSYETGFGIILSRPLLLFIVDSGIRETVLIVVNAIVKAR